jgi:hypothetical protein
MRYFLLAQKGARIEFFDASFNRNLRVDHIFSPPKGSRHDGEWWQVIKVFNHEETRRLECLCSHSGLETVEVIFRDVVREVVIS